MKSIFVVGDKFREFAKHDCVLTLAQFEQLSRTMALGRVLSDAVVVPGQGLSESQVLQVKQMAMQAQDGVPGVERLRGLSQRPVRASRLLTHKRRIENAIISTPVRLGPDSFEAELLLDERSELMGDHQTGQHIQGMVLIEAARQMFLAVTEEFFIGCDDNSGYYFVIDNMEVAFQRFVFPVGASLRYEILDKRVDNRARMHFKVAIEVGQAGKRATRIGFEFTAFLASRIEVKETEQAARVLDTVGEWMGVYCASRASCSPAAPVARGADSGGAGRRAEVAR